MVKVGFVEKVEFSEVLLEILKDKIYGDYFINMVM